MNRVSSTRDPGSPFEKLRSPGRDLVRMDIELFSQFGQRLLGLVSGQSHFRLEGWAVVPAWSALSARVAPPLFVQILVRYKDSRESENRQELLCTYLHATPLNLIKPVFSVIVAPFTKPLCGEINDSLEPSWII